MGVECQGVGTTPLHANERGQTVRFVAAIEPPVYWGISIDAIQTASILMGRCELLNEADVAGCLTAAIIIDFKIYNVAVV